MLFFLEQMCTNNSEGKRFCITYSQIWIWNITIFFFFCNWMKKVTILNQLQCKKKMPIDNSDFFFLFFYTHKKKLTKAIEWNGWKAEKNSYEMLSSLVGLFFCWPNKKISLFIPITLSHQKITKRFVGCMQSRTFNEIRAPIYDLIHCRTISDKYWNFFW